MGKSTKILSTKKLPGENHSIGEKTVSGRKTIVVGVVPRNREIILVKREKKKKGYHNTLLDYNIYPIPEGVHKDSIA
ncbi:MAG: hypothetical protein K8S18_10730, partial [Desulfobacula sp.]|nr:hypothetical protein [Desulfobacula sp.]